MNPTYAWTQRLDHVVKRDLLAVAARDRETTAELLAGMAEFDARQLYRPEGYASMYAWCLGTLNLSEDSALRRIQAARAARRFPAIFDAVAAGRLNLSAVCTLAPHLTPATADGLLNASERRTQAQIRQLIADRFPRLDVPTSVQPVVYADLQPQHATSHVGMTNPEQPTTPACDLSPPLAPPPPAATLPALAPQHVATPQSGAAPPAYTKLAPLAPQRYELRGTMTQEMHDDLRAVQALLGHPAEAKDAMAVLGRALKLLRRKLEQRKFAATSRPGRRRSRGDGRSIPAEVKRAVWQRDGGQCTFVSEAGHRCECRDRLEYDHIQPIARGGRSTVENLRLRCRPHNQFGADCAFGKGFMDEKREAGRASSAGVKARQAAADHAAQAPARAEPQTRAGAETGEDPTKDVRPWLRRLGFRADEVRYAAERCEAIGGAPIHERVRYALSLLAPGRARPCTSTAGGPG